MLLSFSNPVDYITDNKSVTDYILKVNFPTLANANANATGQGDELTYRGLF